MLKMATAIEGDYHSGPASAIKRTIAKEWDHLKRAIGKA